jgi:signal transduction histidine kinase
VWEGSGTLRIDHLVGGRIDGQIFHGILEWHAPMVRGVYDYSKVIVSIIDITDRVMAEEKMADILKSKDEFLASISHELRTPLTSVLGFAEVLRSMEHGAEDEMHSILEIIASQAGDLSNIVEDLLVAARAELGQLSVVSVPIDIHAQIAQVVEGRSGGAKDVGVGERPSHPVRAIGDPERVRQVLRNLLTNAELYGGPTVRVDVDVDESLVRVRVCDDGPGLPPEMRERVFERYYRAQANDGRPGSVGIGLTISRDLARMMGGELAYDHVDGLSVFELTLPTA